MSDPVIKELGRKLRKNHKKFLRLEAGKRSTTNKALLWRSYLASGRMLENHMRRRRKNNHSQIASMVKKL